MSAFVELSWPSTGGRLALEFRDDAPGQDLAQLDAPLIERVDAPDRALGEDAVLVECHQRSERPGGRTLGENEVGRPVPRERPVRYQSVGHALGPDLVAGLSEGQGLGL